MDDDKFAKEVELSVPKKPGSRHDGSIMSGAHGGRVE